jgi:hypothetical protein
LLDVAWPQRILQFGTNRQAATEGRVRHVNGYPTFALGKSLQATYLLVRERAPLAAVADQAKYAIGLLDMFLHEESNPQLDVSKEDARALRETLQQILDRHARDSGAVVDQGLYSELNFRLFKFDNSLQLELARLPVFYVTQKGVLDTRYLILDAAAVYSEYRNRLPAEVIDDTNQAGRCLAFNLPTAAGFHIARATERMIKAEMSAFGCPPQPTGSANWGSYIQELKKTGANKKVIQALTEIKDLHRNPLVHPEQTLGLQEALAFWAVCTSVIGAMVADMETKSPDPSAKITAMLPPGP